MRPRACVCVCECVFYKIKRLIFFQVSNIGIKQINTDFDQV